MRDEQPEVGPETEVEPRPDPRWAAFLPLGIVFFTLGVAGASRGDAWATFLPVGIVFFVLGAQGAARTTKGRDAGKPGGGEGAETGVDEAGDTHDGGTGGGADGGGGGGGD